VPDELRLALFALHQQATVGPCTEAKPWGWNVVESAKWESWNQLGNMSSVEAMRLYVKLIEQEQVHLHPAGICRLPVLAQHRW
jgi:acyl-CoA-binding protein